MARLETLQTLFRSFTEARDWAVENADYPLAVAARHAMNAAEEAIAAITPPEPHADWLDAVKREVSEGLWPEAAYEPDDDRLDRIARRVVAKRCFRELQAALSTLPCVDPCACPCQLCEGLRILAAKFHAIAEGGGE